MASHLPNKTTLTITSPTNFTSHPTYMFATLKLLQCVLLDVICFLLLLTKLLTISHFSLQNWTLQIGMPSTRLNISPLINIKQLYFYDVFIYYLYKILLLLLRLLYLVLLLLLLSLKVIAAFSVVLEHSVL